MASLRKNLSRFPALVQTSAPSLGWLNGLILKHGSSPWADFDGRWARQGFWALGGSFLIEWNQAAFMRWTNSVAARSIRSVQGMMSPAAVFSSRPSGRRRESTVPRFADPARMFVYEARGFRSLSRRFPGIGGMHHNLLKCYLEGNSTKRQATAGNKGGLQNLFEFGQLLAEKNAPRATCRAL